MENIEEIEAFDLKQVNDQKEKQKKQEKEKAKKETKEKLIKILGSEEELDNYFEYLLRTSL